ncbi:MAG TPA: hypothetical protein VG871_19735 [Vicinamibacterales bacterium]|nr:hypothetical protein [Vicinamibacterales bacterium]
MISLTEHLGVPDEVARAYHAACARYGHRAQVTGIDVGARIRKGRHTKELCVRIHIKEKVAHKLLTARERFPKKLGQVPSTSSRLATPVTPAPPSRRRRASARARRSATVAAPTARWAPSSRTARARSAC